MISVKNDAFMMSFWASMGTFLGGIFVIVLVKLLGADPQATGTSKLMGVLQSFSAGVMIFMTCFHLIPESKEVIGDRETMIYFFFGCLAFVFLEEVVIPEEHESIDDAKRKTKKKDLKKKDSWALYRTSLITFIAMALHNIPEGISVYLASLSNPQMGYKLAIAILLHNVPEGMAVGIPLYASTGSIFQVLLWTLINGLAEPFGVLMGGFLLAPFLDEFVLSRCLALVGGIMFCISTHELYPMSIKYSGRNFASFSLITGLFICWAALDFVETYFGHFHGDGHHHHDHHHDHHHHDHNHGH